MLMVAILSWNKDLIIQRVRSIEEARNLKQRLDREDTDYIVHDGVFLCPIKFDHANRELTESEQIEWLQSEVYPSLVREGRMDKKGHGKIHHYNALNERWI
jgi:hypothetical protein